MAKQGMTPTEFKNTGILGLVFACRLLGLFMVLPVLALYTDTIPLATPALIGLSAGIYGLTQALFQLPCGVLSDYFGRRKIIVAGLLIFIFGSLLAAFSGSIWGLILGRAVQGAGAIGSPILALVADTTREEVRTRAMAIIGISIGFTFVLALLLGPILDAYFGLSGIFISTACLAVGAILLLFLLGPTPASKPPVLGKQFKTLMQQRDLWNVNINIFILHAILTASFLILPHKIQEVADLASSQTWYFYLPVLILSLIIVVPFLRYADNALWQNRLMKSAMIMIGIAVGMITYASHWLFLVMGAVLFFVGFNFLEASLPALVSRIVPKESKGSALGVYSLSQFLGMFAGGLLGGITQQWVGSWGIGLGCIFLTCIGWLTLSKDKRSELWQEA